jgi:hydroxyquinol 1,2-dioxygenase
MLFRADDPYLTSDAVFGAKRSLVADFIGHEVGEAAPDGTVVDKQFQTVEWTFVLNPASTAE